MVMMSSHEDTLGLVPCGFLISLNCLDHFHFDPVIAPIAIGHRSVMLCRSTCADGRILDPLMGSKFFTTYFIADIAFLSSLYCSC